MKNRITFFSTVGLCTAGWMLTGAPTAARPLLGPTLVINEVLYDPAPDITGDANQDGTRNGSEDEFVELVNTGAAALDISGWVINDAVSTRHVFPPGTSVGAGCAVLVFGGGSPPSNFFSGALVQTASTGFLGLNNGGDTVTILDAGALPVATMSYPGTTVVADESINLNPDLTGASYVAHSSIPAALNAIQSPGTFVDGIAFGVCIPPGVDTDGDGHPDATDNCPLIPNVDQADCNANLIGDVCDIFSGFSLDCNLNGIPDECDPDCNLNGIPDECDITSGFSLDCNLNGIPDLCDIAAGDCNGNGIPDSCDITSGFSSDVNADGIPDECQTIIAIVLNEIHADPEGTILGDANNDGIRHFGDDEFLEFVNDTGADLDISGWSVSDLTTTRHIFPGGTILPDQCGVVVFGGGTPTGAFGGMTVQTATSTSLSLNNAGDTITLRDAVASIVLNIVYTNAGNNTSINLDPDITGTAYVDHNTIVAAGGALFSPGTQVSGVIFAGCPDPGADTDGDGIPDFFDNCPNDFNPQQEDCDLDGIGDVCDTDPDLNNNGVPDVCEVTLPVVNLVINEIRIDQPGTDLGEFLELRGDPGTVLQNLTLVSIGDGAGGSGTIEGVATLSTSVAPPLTIPADGIFLIAESSFSPAGDVDLVTVLSFENSDNVTHVLVANFSGALTDDLDSADNGILDVTPWLGVVDAVGMLESATIPPTFTEWAYGAHLGFSDVGPDGGFVPGHVWRCADTDAWNIGAFDPLDVAAADSPGAPNDNCAAPPACLGDIAPPGGNGTVNIDDLIALLGAFGPCPAPPAACDADITPPGGNGTVNIDDLITLLGAFGPCP